jgi:DNA-binding MarR family transcriptional regulator
METMAMIPNSTMIDEITRSCLLTRARKVSRVVTSIFDHELRSFGVNGPQFSLMVLISRLGGASRSDIARANQQERSTSTRNLQVLLTQGWVEECQQTTKGRRRPVVVTEVGRDLLTAAMPAWRAAQARTARLLGQEGATAMVDLADSLPLEELVE